MVNGGEERGEAGSDRRDGPTDREGRSSLQTKCRRWRSSSFSGAGETTKTTERSCVEGFFFVLYWWFEGPEGMGAYHTSLCCVTSILQDITLKDNFSVPPRRERKCAKARINIFLSQEPVLPVTRVHLTISSK